MNLEALLHRQIPPEPWEEGDKIPWNDPEFSQRMLREHLSQSHDLASRRFEVIDLHVNWIHQHLLQSQPARVLDLGCGPGFYTSRLAQHGHTCSGIDFSPASIDYARREATEQHLNCVYRHGDVRSVDFGDGYSLAMMIFGEFNMFRREDALAILRKARRALRPNGRLLIEAHTFEYVEVSGRANSFWTTSEHGVFSEHPHLILSESFWHAAQTAAIHRTFVVHIDDASVDRYVETMQAYDRAGYAELLSEAGFALGETRLALPGSPESGEMIVLVAYPA